MEALRREEQYYVSPLADGMPEASQVLAVGQLALIDEPDREDVQRGEDTYALVQGVDSMGRSGGHWRPGGTGWHSTGCEDCRMGICTSFQPRWPWTVCQRLREAILKHLRVAFYMANKMQFYHFI